MYFVLKSLKFYLHYSALHVSDTIVSLIRSFSAAHAVSGPVWCLVRCVLQSCCVVTAVTTQQDWRTQRTNMKDFKTKYIQLAFLFKLPVIVVRFQGNLNFLHIISETQYQKFRENPFQLEPSCSLRTEGWIDRHDKANSSFLQI